MSHHIVSCYMTGIYDGAWCVFIVQIEANENLSGLNSDTFEAFLECHDYKLVKCLDQRDAHNKATDLKTGVLVVDENSSDPDSIYISVLSSLRARTLHDASKFQKDNEGASASLYAKDQGDKIYRATNFKVAFNFKGLGGVPKTAEIQNVDTSAYMKDPNFTWDLE